MTRTCEAERQWSGDEPSCERKNMSKLCPRGVHISRSSVCMLPIGIMIIVSSRKNINQYFVPHPNVHAYT